MVLKSFIDRFNRGDISFINAFGSKDEEEWKSIQRFLKLVRSRGLTEFIDPGAPIDFDDMYTQNLFDRYCYKQPELNDKFIQYICRQLYRNIKYEEGRIYLVLKELNGLSRFFCGDRSRDYSSHEIAYEILGEDFYEPYSNTTDDVYRDVISVLTKDNFDLLCTIVSNEIHKLTFDDYSDEIYETIIPQLAEEQQNENFLNVDKNIVKLMFNDEGTFNFIIKEVLDDYFYLSLLRCHSSAYNSALVDEWTSEVFKKLETIGVGKGVWTSNDLKENIYKIDITENFNMIVSTFLDSLVGYSVNITNFNDYFSLVEETENYSDDFDCLKLRLDDYPSHKDVESYINDSIIDMIEF